MKHIFARLIFFTITLATIGGLIFAFLQYDQIERWVYYRSYTPSAEIEELANRAALSNIGKDHFYFSDPQLKTKDDFNAVCRFPDRSMVLGCYIGSDRKIFILDVSEPKLEGVEVVTAAHEMLHAAYAELSNTEKSRVNTMLKEAILTVKDQRILDIYKEYLAEDEMEAVNELHSILPTEVATLPDNLEEYYSQYFTDRQKVIAVNDAYRDVFLQIESDVAAKQTQLKTLEESINNYKKKLDILGPTIEAKLKEVNEYADSGNAEKYYPALEEYKRLISDYNATVNLLNESVDTYNRLVKEINTLALRQNDLVHSLDSQYKEKDQR